MAKREKKYLHKFVIDRATWKNGSSTTPGPTALVNEDGEKCCLGFLAESCGVDIRADEYGDLTVLPEHDKALIQAKCPSLIRDNDFKPGSDAVGEGDVNNFYYTNDDTVISREEREAKLTAAFAAERIKVTFKGKYPADAPVQPGE